MSRIIPFFTLLLVTATSAPALAQDDASAWSVTELAGDLNFPVDLAFGPDGALYYAELATGNVRVIPAGEAAPAADPVLSVPSSPGGNGGFLGLALDPAFNDSGAFFVYYTMEKDSAENGKINRVTRVTPDGDERVLVDDIPWAEMHDGGRLAFTDPDTLIVTTGDNEKRDPAQDPESLLGKTLRIMKTGAPAPGNPDPESPVFTLGHRNPFGIAYDADADVLWITENGPDRGDEVNVLEAGGNYGWPHALGESDDPAFVDPVLTFEQPLGPTGATVLHGDLYFGDFNFGQVHRVHDAANGSLTHEVVWKVPYNGGHVLDVEAGPDGRLYVGTYSEVFVLTPPGGAMPQPSRFVSGSDGNATGDADDEDGSVNDSDDGSGTNEDSFSPPDGDEGANDELPDERARSPTPGPGAFVAVAAAAAAAFQRRSRERIDDENDGD